MKLTGKLKDKVDNTESMEEKKDIIAQAGIEQTDDELEGVAGGYINNDLYNRVKSCIESQCEDPIEMQKLLIQLSVLNNAPIVNFDKSYLSNYFMEYGIDLSEC